MKNKIKNSDGFKILKYFKVVKNSLILLAVLMIIFCIIGMVNPIVTANLVTSITNFNINNSLIYVTVFLILSILRALVNHLTNRLYLKKIKNKVFLNIRKDMIKNIFNMKTVNFDEHSSGEISERLRNDPESISSILTVVQYSFFSMVTDIIILLYVYYLNIIIGLIYTLSIFIIYFYEKLAFENIKELSIKTKKLNDKNSTLLNETMRGIRDIKLLNMMKPFYKLVSKGLSDTTENVVENELKHRVVYEVVESIQSITVFIIVLLSILLINNNLLTVTNLLVIYMYKTNIFDLTLCYTSIKEQLVEYKIAASRIFELADKEKFPKDTYGNIELSNIKGKIEFRNLDFSYNNRKKIIDNVNLTIEPNDTIGIVGESGSGKTTLLNLLSKNYYVKNNQILIDEIDINDLTKNSIRNNVSVISQNPYIFNLTIKENLELAGNNVTKKDIIETCKIAQIHDYIMSLPNQYDTLLGEGGTNLSGGQKQRLAIARALIKKTKIILFDEATSALDNITQTELQKSINNITKDHTILIVAHRLSTIKDCNKIVVLDKGKIVGVGTHETLLKNNKIYKKLYKEENI